MALTDELTGLLNRRGFTLALQRELSLARRDKNAGGVLIMADLDGFKSINDLWGHCAGDDYLQGVAHALLTEVRATDIVARIGGDEFAILFTHMSEEIGISRMSRLEKSFNSRMMQWRDKVLPLRASFGLSVYAGTDAPESIMKTADLRLYAHKARRKAKRG
jgi:diguanylate cyclase (GGDEF)-like protein